MAEVSYKPRTPESVEFSKIKDFLNIQLRPNESWSINQEYPTAICENNIHNFSIINHPENGRIVSHALMRPFICKTPYAIFKIAAIGSVVTDPEYRNQGFSRKNILQCLQKAEEQDCDFTILWSDKHEFYRQFGFELAGFEHAFILSKPQPLHHAQCKVLKSTRIDPRALLKIYNQHTVHSVRTVEDIQAYLQIPQTSIFTLWTNDNQLLAYAVEGKGADLQNYIHEWGGSVTAVSDLISQMMTTEQKSYTLIAPHHSINLISSLKKYCDSYNEGFLGLIKINQFERLAAKIKKMFLAEGISDFICEKKNSEIIYGLKNDLYTLKNENDFVKLVFGPTMIRDLKFMNSEVVKKLEKVFPLPLWIWGWDSI